MTIADEVVAAIRGGATAGDMGATGVDVHFHPDALARSGRTVLEELVRDRRWRTQWETGTSNGGLTAVPGGERWGWESGLFDGRYDQASPDERPVYGALRVAGDRRGAAPRFGSAHLHLGREVLSRTTICYPDSVFGPTVVGTADRAGAVLLALQTIALDDPLDRYVEAHVHGGLRITDVEALVLDPSFRGTAVESVAAAWPGAVEWHDGFVLDAGAIHGLAGYRGEAVRDAAVRVAEGRPLTPYRLGLARPGLDPSEAKRVWHLLARFGAAAEPSTTGGSAAPA